MHNPGDGWLLRGYAATDPFVEREVSRDPTRDAVETERNRNWNPNAALQRNPAAATLPPPAVVAPGATTETGTPGATPANPAASTDPLGELMQARTGGAPSVAPVTTASGPDPFRYLVQAGAVRTPADAEAQRAKLAMLGVNAQVAAREQSGRTVYRVRVGPFESRSEADSVQSRLDGSGFETALVRVARDTP